MSIYAIENIGEKLKENSYPGRGIVIGTTPDGKNAVSAYFIMGRSENSRNRVFVKENETLTIYPFDPSLVSDPTLIIYAPVRRFENKLIVTNGDQTDTIYDGLVAGKSFAQALSSRTFEPDAPNLTPRISGMLTFEENGFSYEMSILKSIDATGTAPTRMHFAYPAIKGLGHFLHTYLHDGDPIPTFVGEPERVATTDDIDAFTAELWDNLHADNKISLYVEYNNLSTGESVYRLKQKNNT